MSRQELAWTLVIVAIALLVFFAYAWVTDPTVYP